MYFVLDHAVCKMDGHPNQEIKYRHFPSSKKQIQSYSGSMLYLFFHQIKPSEASILEYLVLVEDCEFCRYQVSVFCSSDHT